MVEFGRRHAWQGLLALAVVVVLFGIGDVIRGMDADPAIPRGVAGMSPDEIREASEPLATLTDMLVRAGGVHLTVMGLLWTVLVLVPYRRGEQWARFAMWTLPAWSLAVAVSFLFVDLVPDEPVPPPAISGWIFFVLTAGLLLLGPPATEQSPSS